MLLCMMCSSILHEMDVNDTGLQFAAICRSPFLKMGTTRAFLQSCGISPWSRVRWYIRASIGASWLAAALMINSGISSGPAAL
jgi:hypothetical protein